MSLSQTSEIKTKEQAHIADQITIAKDVKRVSCNGGGGTLGHPQIWLTMTAEERAQPAKAVCPYCSRQFIHAD